MRIVYLGTPDFSVNPLKTIVESGENVVAVITNKDKPVGRKQILTPPPVKVYAESKGIKVFQYDSIRKEGVEDLKALKPDLMITCAFGQILSKEILDIPTLYTLNIHASLLPKYRGASPINYAILNGEKVTGITIMKTDEGIDTGDELLKKELVINDGETAGELFERLSYLGADCIMQALDLVKSGSAEFTKQNHSEATFTKIIKKEDARIDFTCSAEQIVNKIRAFNPAPVAFCMLNGEPFKIYSATAISGNANAGEVVENQKQLLVGTGSGLLKIEKVQKAGGKPLNVADFLRGNGISLGAVLG